MTSSDVAVADLMEETSSRPLLKKLSEKHKLVAALLAQGVSREKIAAAAEYTPQYITWLQADPLFIAHVREMTAAAQTQLEAMYHTSVEVIGQTLVNGSEDGKLKAVKLHGELTGRLGRNADQERPHEGDRLEVLADRLVSLLHTQRRRVLDGEVSDAEVLPSAERARTDSIQGSQPSGDQPPR